MLSETNSTEMLVAGRAGTGKRSIVDLHIKNCQDKLDSHIIRLKRHNQFYLGGEIERILSRLPGVRESWIKPVDISKRAYICIEDVNLAPRSQSSCEFLRMILS